MDPPWRPAGECQRRAGGGWEAVLYQNQPVVNTHYEHKPLILNIKSGTFADFPRFGHVKGDWAVGAEQSRLR